VHYYYSMLLFKSRLDDVPDEAVSQILNFLTKTMGATLSRRDYAAKP